MEQRIDYKQLVLQCLQKGRYPILLNFVTLDLYYKCLDNDCVTSNIRHTRYSTPEDLYEKENQPFQLIYVVHKEPYFGVQTKQTPLDTHQYPLQCRRVLLHRSVVNDFFKLKCETFEEEIYTFLTFLNFDLIALKTLLGLDFATCTRWLPQQMTLWVYHYTTLPICNLRLSQPECFGPCPDETRLATRIIRGKLSPCVSKRTLLSLNNDLQWTQRPEGMMHHPYNMHYSEQWNTYIPLAFNPLENPILHD